MALLVANSNGVISGSFVIPPKVPVGVKSFKVTGGGGSRGEALFTGGGKITTTTLKKTVNQFIRYDPLAQTFTLEEDRILTGIELKFCAKGVKDVTIQLRECEVGLPNEVVLTTGRISASAITTGNVWTRILFDEPHVVQGGREYAVVIMSDEATPSVAIATIGDYVTAGNGPQEGYITGQPIINGVLLSSSNASTWTPHQKSDLTFRLLAAKFAPTTRTINLGNVAVANMTDFLLKSNVARPSSVCDVKFKITVLGTGESYIIRENEAYALSTRIANDTVNIEAQLTGDAKMSPYLYPDSLFVKGDVGSSGTYITRSIPAAPTFTITVNLAVFKPGTSTINPMVQVHKQVSGTDQYTGTEPITEWLAIAADPLFENRDLGNGWVEVSFKRTGLRGIGVDRITRVRIDNNGNPLYRPRVKDIRAFSKV